MKKSYSSLNLLQERLFGSTEEKGLLKYLFTPKRNTLTIRVPYYDYLRGTVFIDDLRDNFEEEVPFQFALDDLLYMLYKDFLAQIKKGARNEQIAEYLIHAKRRHFNKRTKQKRVLRPLTEHVLEFETVEEHEDTSLDHEAKTAYLELRMRQTEVLRAEVLIHDLEPYLNGVEVTLEEVITMVYLDFIDNIKKEGNSIKVQKSILAHMKRY